MRIFGTKDLGKKIGLNGLVLAVCGVMVLPGHAMTLETKGEKVTVQIALDGDPVTLGRQQAKINILDAEGNPVNNAKVKLYYGLPPSEDSPGVNYKTRAKLLGEHYSATIDLSSEGMWQFKVNVSTVDGIEEKVSVSVEVE